MRKLLFSFVLGFVVLLPAEFFSQFSISVSPTACANQSIMATITISPPGSGIYAWFVSPSGFAGIISQTQARLTFTNCGVYTITCVAFNTSNVPTNTVTVTSTVTCPALTITPSTQTICAGGAATLTASGAGSYAWSNSQNVPVINPTPSATTVYSVVGNVNSCVAAATVAVVSLSINASYTAACQGNTVALNAFGANTYSWTGSSLGSPVVQNSISVPAGSYTVSSAGSSGNCTTNITVSLAPPMSVSVLISPLQATTCIETNYPQKLSKPMTLIASATAVVPPFYVWYPYSPTIPNAATITVRPAVSTCYTVVAISPNSACTTSALVCISVLPQFTMTVSPAQSTICSGQSVKLSITNIQTPFAVGPASLFTCYWIEPPTSPLPSLSAQNTFTVDAFPQTNTTYSVEVFDARGCASLPFLATVNTTTCLDTGVKKNEGDNDRFTVYPNPSQDLLVIQSKTEIPNLHVEFSDLLGKTLITRSLICKDPDSEYSIDLVGMRPGVYLLNILSGNKILYHYNIIKE